jgi:hypothetical protein
MLGHSIVSQHFMEPEGSIPNSQGLSTCSYPEPKRSLPFRFSEKNCVRIFQLHHASFMSRLSRAYDQQNTRNSE